MKDLQPRREQWGTRLGAILAVSGSAVGLGNFLRFPGVAASNGGGAFMIPYFISLVLLGIPICWAEWTMGREGGRRGFNSAPGVLYVLVKNPVLRAFGGLAILIPVVIYMYYGYIEAWCLAYAWDYARGSMNLGVQVENYTNYFADFVGGRGNGLTKHGELSRVVYFVAIVYVLNFVLIYRGVTRGIEKFCRFAMPLLLVGALATLVRVLTLPAQPVPEPWQYSLAEALPPAKWTGLLKKLRSLEAAAVAAEKEEADQTEEGRAHRVAEARAALDAAVKAAVAGYYGGVRAGTAGYVAGVPVSEPYGILASYRGILGALDEVENAKLRAAQREWIDQARKRLTRTEKWALQYCEEAEAKAQSNLAGNDREKQAAARRVLASVRAERLEILEGVGLPPSYEQGDDKEFLLRLAAAEVAELDRTVSNGLGFMWNPRTAEGGDSIIAALKNPQVWMAAASQIFFSLSVGFGIIMTYSTYLRRRDDVVLSALTAASVNETCEVCLGGMITVPAAFIFLGLGAVTGAGTFDLGFYTTPAVFAQMPAGQFFGTIWFGALFLAAITSSLSMLQPAIAFLEEGFGLRRNGSTVLLGLLTALGALVVMYFSEGLVALDTMDFWIGQFSIFIMATVMVIVFGWVVGAKKGTDLASDGAQLRLPSIFPFVIKYVSPAYLLTIFVLWVKYNAPDYARQLIDNDQALFVVFFIGLTALFFVVLVRLANKRWTANGRKGGEARS
jgi:SNF family Na+-dependent transporter